MNLTYVPSLTVSGSEGSRPGPWAPAANRLRRSRKKVIYSLVPAVSRTFFKKVSSSRPRAPLRGPLADSVPPFRGAPSSEGLAIIPRIGGIASVFRDFFDWSATVLNNTRSGRFGRSQFLHIVSGWAYSTNSKALPRPTSYFKFSLLKYFFYLLHT